MFRMRFLLLQYVVHVNWHSMLYVDTEIIGRHHVVGLGRFGWTRCPASVIVMPWTMTWSMTVALISSVMKMRSLARPPSPLPPLTQTPLLLPWSSIFVWNLQQTDLYRCCHTICNRCFQLWVVLFTEWHQVCSLCSSFADCGWHFASHELHNAYWSRDICKMCFSKAKCVWRFEKKGMGFVNSVYRWIVFVVVANGG